MEKTEKTINWGKKGERKGKKEKKHPEIMSYNLFKAIIVNS